MKIVTRFKNDPSTYYAMSIAATWAGVGSLMMGIEMAQKHGLLPFLLWSLGNTLACIVYGILAPSIPKLRDVFRSKIMRTITGLMCPFQVWISLNGIQMIFSETPLSRHFGTAFAVIVAVTYIVMLWHRGMIRNVLHDHISWIAVYALAFVVTVLAIYSSGFSPISLGADASSLSVGVNKMLLLVPGAFLYPYFFEILDYNDDNADGTHKVDIRRAFVNRRHTVRRVPDVSRHTLPHELRPGSQYSKGGADNAHCRIIPIIVPVQHIRILRPPAWPYPKRRINSVVAYGHGHGSDGSMDAYGSHKGVHRTCGHNRRHSLASLRRAVTA